MSVEEDILRHRNDIADLYEKLRCAVERVIKLEAEAVSRNEKIEDLKEQIGDLKTLVTEKLEALSIQITALSNAPAQKVASRWDEAVKAALVVAVTAGVTYLLTQLGGK
jgi:hypothetical protein